MNFLNNKVERFSFCLLVYPVVMTIIFFFFYLIIVAIFGFDPLVKYSGIDLFIFNLPMCLVSIVFWLFYQKKYLGKVTWGYFNKKEVAFFAVLIVVLDLIFGFIYSEEIPFMRDFFKYPTSINITRFIAATILAPIFEEILFRGFFLELFIIFNKKIILWLGIVAISVCFALIHIQYPLEMQIQVGLLGAIFLIARLRSGGLLLPILLHVAVNTVSLILLLFGFN